MRRNDSIRREKKMNSSQIFGVSDRDDFDSTTKTNQFDRFQEKQSSTSKKVFELGKTTIEFSFIRRHRCFKREQLQMLHHVYRQETHPNLNVLQQLAKQLEAPIEKVQVKNLFTISFSPFHVSSFFCS